MNTNKYIQTLIQFTELKASNQSSRFCQFSSLSFAKSKLPCNLQDPLSNSIHCINCIFNNEDEQPRETRKLLANIIQTDKET
jgi:hypothetical protein